MSYPIGKNAVILQRIPKTTTSACHNYQSSRIESDDNKKSELWQKLI